MKSQDTQTTPKRDSVTDAQTNVQGVTFRSNGFLQVDVREANKTKPLNPSNSYSSPLVDKSNPRMFQNTRNLKNVVQTVSDGRIATPYDMAKEQTTSSNCIITKDNINQVLNEDSREYDIVIDTASSEMFKPRDSY